MGGTEEWDDVDKTEMGGSQDVQREEYIWIFAEYRLQG